MKSFGLLRTNVGLTTNIKIMVTSDYKLSLDSIDSDTNLSFDKFKKVSFNKNNYYDELIPYFYKDLPVDTAFHIKYDSDEDTMSNDFSNQYDEIYQYGARNIINNKNYKEEFEYFSPLYITKNNIPKNFIIFRVDGSGIGTTNRLNFKGEVLSNLKTVKIFDLTKNTALGEWLNINFIENIYFPDTPLEIDFRNLEFSRWNGIDYQNGGYTSKSLFIDDILDEEKEIFELEKFIFDSYKNNKVVFPNILNLSFLFDDTPSTPEQKRKWSINRYYGFYLDELELVKTVSPYLPPVLNNDVVILEGNILSSDSETPFVNGWSDSRPFYVEFDGVYYIVEKFTEIVSNQLVKINNIPVVDDNSIDLGFRSSKTSVKRISTRRVSTSTKSSIEDFTDVTVTKYRIISDIDLSGKESRLNKNFAQIDNNNVLITNTGNFDIENFDDYDVWVIEIDGVYHNIVKLNDTLLLNTDYSFSFTQNGFEYKVGGDSKSVSIIVDFNNPPKTFPIYKVRFSDIKDFDDKLIDTEYSKYEYEELDTLTKTDETKMYFEDISSKSDPIDLDDFKYGNEVVNIPVSSEYTANYETFKIEGGKLSDIWRKNSIYCRWGYQNSLSGNDVPYLLNNSLIFEDYNRTVNTFDPNPNRVERNLDYFYSINSASSSYTHHTLHIQELNDNKDVDSTFKFDLNKYLNGTYSYWDPITSSTQSATHSNDYFTYLFSKKSEFLRGDIVKNTNKFSLFNIGDDSITNNTLFRGIKFNIYDVDSVELNFDGTINKINLERTNNFNDYKLSVLLSDNVDKSKTPIKWHVIEEWNMDRDYLSTISNPDIVIKDDILYISTNTKLSKDVKLDRGLLDQGWSIYKGETIFWNPLTLYVDDQDIEIFSFGRRASSSSFWFNRLGFVYNSGEYYYFTGSRTGVDFWNPDRVKNSGSFESIGYSKDEVVLFKNKYYKSLVDDNRVSPIIEDFVVVSNGGEFEYIPKYWVETSIPSDVKWKPINVWNPSIKHTDRFIVHNNTIYFSNTTNSIGEEPGVSGSWVKRYTIVPDTNTVYVAPGSSNVLNNSVIEMNGSYYLCLSNPNRLTLENGITIYINKKWKNILVNINVSDNTYGSISGINRDDIYKLLFRKLTAYNFISAVNDISNKQGFIDYLSYVVIDENLNIERYSVDNNIENIPHLIRCETPDSINVKVQSLFKRPVQLPSTLNPTRKLDDGLILNLSQLNYYNNVPVGANIIENKFPPKVFENFSGNKNIVSNTLYRYSGYYSPLFYDIQLFSKDYKYNGFNYKFDTELTDFGIVKERRVRKVNRNGSVLKMKDVMDDNSVYPMLDEFGYTTYDFFIFSSTWDSRYYIETSKPSITRDFLQRYTNLENSIENVIDESVIKGIGQTLKNKIN